MKVIKKHYFTLLEVMVSMGVFCLLMLALMQLFSGTQDVWSKTGKRTELYSSAHLAMRYLTDDLTELYHCTDPDSNIRSLSLPDATTLSLVTQHEGKYYEVGYKWQQSYTENGKTYYTGRLYRGELTKNPNSSSGDYELPWFSRPDESYSWTTDIQNRTNNQDQWALLDDVIYFSIKAYRKKENSLEEITSITPSSSEEIIPAAFLVTMVVISQETKDKLNARGYSPESDTGKKGIAKLFEDNKKYIVGGEDPYTDSTSANTWGNEQSPERILADECQVFSRIILMQNGTN